MEEKKCKQCGEKKPLTCDFWYKQSKVKDGFNSWCKICHKKYKKKKGLTVEQREKQRVYFKGWYDKNKERMLLINAKWAKEHPERMKIAYRKCQHRSVNFKAYAHKLDLYHRIRKSVNGKLEVVCHYCDNYFQPILNQVNGRIWAINGKVKGQSTENNFYCSDHCKMSCSTYGRSVNERGFSFDKSSREVQPELRKMCFERDSWLCQRCGSGESLECHHIEGVEQNPIESADLDIVITFCKTCHKKAHKEIGCRYIDLRKC